MTDPAIEAMRIRGMLNWLRMFSEILECGIRRPDSSALRVDVLLWCTGFRSSLDHLAPLILRESGGGITMTGKLATKVERDLKKFDAKARGKAGLETALGNLISSIELDTYYEETATEVDRVIAEQDYAQALHLYNNKGLLGKIEPLFGFARKGMPELVKRLASATEGAAVLAAIQEELPKVQA